MVLDPKTDLNFSGMKFWSVDTRRDLFNLKGHCIRTVVYANYGFKCCRLHKNKTKRQSHTYQIPLKLRIWVNWDTDKNICGFVYVTVS